MSATRRGWISPGYGSGRAAVVLTKLRYAAYPFHDTEKSAERVAREDAAAPLPEAEIRELAKTRLR